MPSKSAVSIFVAQNPRPAHTGRFGSGLVCCAGFLRRDYPYGATHRDHRRIVRESGDVGQHEPLGIIGPRQQTSPLASFGRRGPEYSSNPRARISVMPGNFLMISARAVCAVRTEVSVALSSHSRIGSGMTNSCRTPCVCNWHSRADQTRLASQIYLGSSHSRDHLRAEWMFWLDTTSFAGPPVLTDRSISDRCEVVLGHRRSPQVAVCKHIRCGPFPASRVAQLTRTKALLKLLLIQDSVAPAGQLRDHAAEDDGIVSPGRPPRRFGSGVSRCRRSRADASQSGDSRGGSAASVRRGPTARARPVGRRRGAARL
jgi:hypothetical protein